MMTIATTTSSMVKPDSPPRGGRAAAGLRLFNVFTRTAAVPPGFDSTRAAEDGDGRSRLFWLRRVVYEEREIFRRPGAVDDRPVGLERDVELLVGERREDCVVAE